MERLHNETDFQYMERQIKVMKLDVSTLKILGVNTKYLEEIIAEDEARLVVLQNGGWVCPSCGTLYSSKKECDVFGC